MNKKRLQVTVTMFLLTFALGFSANLLNVAYGKGKLPRLGTLLISNNILTVVIEDALESEGIGTFTIGTGPGHQNPG